MAARLALQEMAMLFMVLTTETGSFGPVLIMTLATDSSLLMGPTATQRQRPSLGLLVVGVQVPSRCSKPLAQTWAVHPQQMPYILQC